jgi:hypothetical protein
LSAVKVANRVLQNALKEQRQFGERPLRVFFSEL